MMTYPSGPLTNTILLFSPIPLPIHFSRSFLLNLPKVLSDPFGKAFIPVSGLLTR